MIEVHDNELNTPKPKILNFDDLKSVFFSHRNLVSQIEKTDFLTEEDLNEIRTKDPILYEAIIDIKTIKTLPEAIRLEITRNPRNLEATIENHTASLSQQQLEALQRIRTKISVHDTVQISRAALNLKEQ